MLRPAPLLERLTSPCRQLAPPTRPPVYGRACPSRGLPQPGSAMTTRPNDPLPRQDLHLQACQRPTAAHKNLLLRAVPTQRFSELMRRHVKSPGASQSSFPAASSRCPCGVSLNKPSIKHYDKNGAIP